VDCPTILVGSRMPSRVVAETNVDVGLDVGVTTFVDELGDDATAVSLVTVDPLITTTLPR
jgi:hypothetical protein